MKNDSAKEDQDLTISFSVERTPQEVFEAIINVRAWWSGNIEGPTDKLGGEFTYRYEELHYSKQKVSELVPGKRVVWLVLDATMTFIEDQSEWTGTKVVFDIARKGDKTEVRFTHVGLVPSHECYGACSSAWSSYVRGSLRSLIMTGSGQPNAKEKTRTQSNHSSSTRA